jgi:AcrR family transcriptional regulator
MKDTRSNILAAARDLFEKRGFAAATTKDIAALAGVSEVTLFRHFATKRALFDETLHSCLHPYTVEEYLKSGVAYDLERDLKHIAYDTRDNFRKNAPMIRMIMRDKIRGSVPEMDMKNKEHHMKTSLLAYFNAMRSSGALSAPPKMAMKFFMTNITGSIMKELMMEGHVENDDTYFDWMLDQVIRILSTGSGKDIL